MTRLATAPSSVNSSLSAIYNPSVFSRTIIKSIFSANELVLGYDLTGLKLANIFISWRNLTITSAALSPAAPKRHASAFLTMSSVFSGSA